MFPTPREQAKAIGVYGFVASAGGSIGLLAGGALTQAISWHWIFLINLPIGIAVALGALRLVEGRPGIGLRAGADVPGAALITGSLMIGDLHDPRHQPARLELDPDPRPRPRLGRRSSPPSSPARRGSPTR